MMHELTYSIITHIKAQVTELVDVVWIYDGVTLTGKTKPFGTVEQMAGNTNIIAKEREYFETFYRFQVGLHAKSIAERSRLQEKIKNALLQPNIALLDTSQPFPPPTVGFFYCDVLAVTPIPVADVTDETNKNLVYFDVEIYVQRKNGEADLTKFEQ
ncbi:hypothetical protein [Bacillus sp. 03113]|uniref:hypothetical protein n=1 Tax=Bacillus sp. 03113 TaxID=2578211 RepID=UPI001141F17E|nr:hypothetical protein [Bacillus sp. 03113]